MEHGGHGYSQQNPEGESILSFAQAYNLVVANTYFQKKDKHLITYKSGDRCSTVDYIITRREKLKNIKDCKVIPGECAITQHRILVMDYKSSLRRMARPRKKPTNYMVEDEETGRKGCIHTSSDAENLE